jgi:hypothetical protein
MRYDELNKLSLENARHEIVKNLIGQQQIVKNRLDELEKEYKLYEDDYIKARAEGDASENSALDTAINNMSSAQASIYKNTQLLRYMDCITEPEYVQSISSYDYEYIIKTLQATESNAIMSAAVKSQLGSFENIKTINRDTAVKLVRTLDSMWNLPNFIQNETEDEIYHLVKKTLLESKQRPYKPCGKAVMYSAIRVAINGVVYTFMLCPEGISFVTDGIVSVDTILGSSILNSTVTGKKQILNQNLEYVIQEIY